MLIVWAHHKRSLITSMSSIAKSPTKALRKFGLTFRPTRTFTTTTTTPTTTKVSHRSCLYFLLVVRILFLESRARFASKRALFSFLSIFSTHTHSTLLFAQAIPTSPPKVTFIDRLFISGNKALKEKDLIAEMKTRRTPCIFHFFVRGLDFISSAKFFLTLPACAISFKIL